MQGAWKLTDQTLENGGVCKGKQIIPLTHGPISLSLSVCMSFDK